MGPGGLGGHRYPAAMLEVEVVAPIDDRLAREAAALAAASPRAGEHAGIDAGRAALARRHDPQVAGAVVSHSPSGQLRGFLQVTRQGRAWALDLVVDPALDPVAAERLALDLMARARPVVAARGGGEVSLWIRDPGPADDARARHLGLTPGRQLLELRRPVTDGPPPAVRGSVPDATTRPFVAGLDEASLLEVNNRAFVRHPEQGGWTPETLAERMAEPWFDPAGLLLIEDGAGHLLGFCWTKVDPGAGEPDVGELYVVAVDPDVQGRGLGTELVAAGLQRLASAGMRTAALYVGSEEPALRLYRRSGFVDHAVEQAYTTVVESAALTGAQVIEVPAPTSEPTP